MIKFLWILILLFACEQKSAEQVVMGQSSKGAVESSAEEDCEEKAAKAEIKKIETLSLQGGDEGCTLDANNKDQSDLDNFDDID